MLGENEASMVSISKFQVYVEGYKNLANHCPQVQKFTLKLNYKYMSYIHQGLKALEVSNREETYHKCEYIILDSTLTYYNYLQQYHTVYYSHIQGIVVCLTSRTLMHIKWREFFEELAGTTYILAFLWSDFVSWFINVPTENEPSESCCHILIHRLLIPTNKRSLVFAILPVQMQKQTYFTPWV